MFLLKTSRRGVPLRRLQVAEEGVHQRRQRSVHGRRLLALECLTEVPSIEDSYLTGSSIELDIVDSPPQPLASDVAWGSKVGEPRIRQWRRPNVNRPIWTLGSCWPIHRATSIRRPSSYPMPRRAHAEKGNSNSSAGLILRSLPSANIFVCPTNCSGMGMG